MRSSTSRDARRRDNSLAARSHCCPDSPTATCDHSSRRRSENHESSRGGRGFELCVGVLLRVAAKNMRGCDCGPRSLHSKQRRRSPTATGPPTVPHAAAPPRPTAAPPALRFSELSNSRLRSALRPLRQLPRPAPRRRRALRPWRLLFGALAHLAAAALQAAHALRRENQERSVGSWRRRGIIGPTRS